jgi:hypothetical protein
MRIDQLIISPPLRLVYEGAGKKKTEHQHSPTSKFLSESTQIFFPHYESRDSPPLHILESWLFISDKEAQKVQFLICLDVENHVVKLQGSLSYPSQLHLILKSVQNTLLHDM